MINTYPDLFFGYNVIWGIIVLYVAYLGIKLSRLEKLISDKAKQIDSSK